MLQNHIGAISTFCCRLSYETKVHCQAYKIIRKTLNTKVNAFADKLQICTTNSIYF